MLGPYWDLTKSVCESAGVDPVIIYAIIGKESSYNPWAMRYEPFFKYTLAHREWASRLGLSQETELMAQKTSWGLGQLMGGVARELGFKGHLPELCVPEVSLPLCVRHFKNKLQKYGEEGAVAAYNQGNDRRTPSGMFANQVSYVDPVYRKIRELRKLTL